MAPDALYAPVTRRAQLPPKSQIKSVHVTRDQFEAESANPGDTFVEIITQPGIGPIHGGFNSSVRAGDLSARNPFAPERGADHNQRFGLNVGSSWQQYTGVRPGSRIGL